MQKMKLEKSRFPKRFVILLKLSVVVINAKVEEGANSFMWVKIKE